MFLDSGYGLISLNLLSPSGRSKEYLLAGVEYDEIFKEWKFSTQWQELKVQTILIGNEVIPENPVRCCALSWENHV